MPNIGGTYGARSCSHAHRDTTKNAVSEIVGYIKGKSAIAVARQFSGRKRNFNGEALWARGYAVSTVGFEESQIKRYIQNQEQLDGGGTDEDGKF